MAPLAERLLRDVFDAGLCLGHSVRTPEQACRLACGEPMICTSLVESRLLARQRSALCPLHAALSPPGAPPRPLAHGRHSPRPRARTLRYGETVFLLEPNVKRSRGTLRDIQLIRWIGLRPLRHGRSSRIARPGRLSEEDLDGVLRADEFLLRLRNELHFHARQAADVLDRAEQLRIAELRGYLPQAGLLPVEQFMRDYFRHTGAVSHIAARFVGQGPIARSAGAAGHGAVRTPRRGRHPRRAGGHLATRRGLKSSAAT